MNVKPGDIARIVVRPNKNRLVRVLELKRNDPLTWACECLQPCVVNGTTRVAAGSLASALDSSLRPLYDGDDEDEMLRIAGKPNEQPADFVRDLMNLRDLLRD